MRINHNLAALNAYGQLSKNTAAQSKSLEKLSSGQRINRAGDDAAGLAISEKMRGQIRGLDQASRNASDGISMIQTAEGALNETHSMLQRMRELAVQANNDTNTSGAGSDRAAIQLEINELNSEITNIANKTTFNTKNLLDGTLGVKNDTTTGTAINTQLAALGATVTFNGVGSGVSVTITATSVLIQATSGGIVQTLTAYATATGFAAGAVLDFDKIGLKITLGGGGSLTAGTGTNLSTTGTTADFQIGANKNTVLSISINDMRATAIGAAGGLTSVSQVNVTTQTFTANVDSIDKAISDVSTQRAQLGAWQNRLEHTINNLGTSSENLTAAESRVRDVDMAKEMMEFTKNNILTQASTAMLAQANQQPQGVLQLLR